MRAHVIEGGCVVNTIEVDSLGTLTGIALVDAEHGGSIGDLYDGSTFTTPPRWPDIPTAQAARRRECDLLAKAKRDAIVADYSAAEMTSWPIKRAEALAWQTSGNAADAPLLSIEATARGVSLSELVTLVLNKANTLSQLEAAIAGNNGKHNDAIDALAATEGVTAAQIDAYDITTGWPV